MIHRLRAYNKVTKELFEVWKMDCMEGIPYPSDDSWEGHPHNDFELMPAFNIIDNDDKPLFDTKEPIYANDIVSIHEFYYNAGFEDERETRGILRYSTITRSEYVPQWYLETPNRFVLLNDMYLHENSFTVLGNIYEGEFK